jgi:hypothetical protein
MSSLIKIRPAETELFHADGRTDGRTDMPKVTVAFRNFPKAPKNTIFFISLYAVFVYYKWRKNVAKWKGSKFSPNKICP